MEVEGSYTILAHFVLNRWHTNVLLLINLNVCHGEIFPWKLRCDDLLVLARHCLARLKRAGYLIILSYYHI